MSELVGQPIVVENKPGAATNLGADFVAKGARPTATPCCSAMSRARFLSVLVTNPKKLKVNSVAELIDQAKREPGKIDIAHAGVGNPFPSRCRAVPQAAGIKLNEVPYRGAGPAAGAARRSDETDRRQD